MQRVVDLVQTKVNDFNDKLNTLTRQMDAKFVSFRKDCDIDAFKLQLKGKADAVNVTADLKNHEFKIGLLDQNVMMIANDFSIFQTSINTMHNSLVEL